MNTAPPAPTLPSEPTALATSATGARPLVLVTGAAKRIGRVIALDLAARGYDLALHCRHSRAEAEATAAEVRALGAQAEVFAADLCDEAACRALLPAVWARFGRLDALINNASVFEYDDALTTDMASLDAHWRANTVAPVLLAQGLGLLLKDQPQRRACVVNLLDQKLWNPNPDHFAYTLSKAALREATTLLAQALAPQIRVAAVAPGLTLVSGPMTEAEYAKAHTLTPLQRSSSAEDIAHAVRFLIESPAITGTTLLVDGGQHLAAQSRDVLFLAQTAT